MFVLGRKNNGDYNVGRRASPYCVVRILEVHHPVSNKYSKNTVTSYSLVTAINQVSLNLDVFKSNVKEMS